MRATGGWGAWISPHSESSGEAEGINRLVVDVGVREAGESRGRAEIPEGRLKRVLLLLHTLKDGGLGRG